MKTIPYLALAFVATMALIPLILVSCAIASVAAPHGGAAWVLARGDRALLAIWNDNLLSP